MDLTNQQKAVLNATGATLVTASAGTGKTAILTEKVVNELLNSPKEVTIDRILCVTFSSAAAEEMKERIGNALKKAEKDQSLSSEMRSNAYYCLKYFSQANITTLHSFCLQVIKEDGLAYGIDSSVEVANETDIATLKQKAIETVLEREYKNKTFGFIELERYLSQYNTDIGAILLQATDKIYSFAHPEEWMNKAINIYSDAYPDEIAVYIMDTSENITYILNKALDICLALEDQDKLIKVEQALREDLSIAEKIFEFAMDGDIKEVNPLLINKFGSTVRFPDVEGIERVKELRKEAKTLFDKAFGKDFDLQENLTRISNMKSVAYCLFNLLKEIDRVYQSLKLQEGVLDFNDMEKMALKILSDDTISTRYKNKFWRVFVDEYQDTSIAQEEIINQISYPDRLFCVGDVKQSIYGFRQAESSLFTSRMKRYKKGEGQVLALSSNFRSNKNVLDCVNDVFDKSSMTYTNEDQLVAGTDKQDSVKGAETEIHLLPDTLKADFPGLSKNQIEISYLASLIKSIVGQKIPDRENGGERDITYGDIAILSRNVAFMAVDIQDIFTANGIPFSLDRSGDLLETTEISFLLDVLNLVCNIKDDLRIISVIHSGIAGLNDKDLMLIRQVDKEASIYDNMLTLSNSSIGSISSKCKGFFDSFEYFSKLQYEKSLADVIRDIVAQFRLKDYVASTIRNGQQASANIEAFINFAENYQQKQKDKLYGFLKAIEAINNYEGISIAEASNTVKDAVSITSIHKSKGLEYPVVILAFAGKSFNLKDKKDAFLITKDGIGLRYYNYAKAEKGDTLARKALAYKETLNEKAEEIRLLYVGMTRAREKLFIVSEDKPVCKEDYRINSYIEVILNAIIGDKGKLRNDLNGIWKICHADKSSLTVQQGITNAPIDSSDFLKEFDFQTLGANTIKPASANLNRIPASLASSTLDKSLNVNVSELTLPDISGKMSAADKGTILHKFMKNLNFKRTIDSDLSVEIDRMLQAEILTKEEVNTLNLQELRVLFRHPTWKAIAASNHIQKEKPLSALLTEYDGNQLPQELLVRCIIDLVVKKGDEWWLIDYKTDHFQTGSDFEIEQRQQEHKNQIMIYKSALENCGYKIGKVMIAYTKLSKFVEYPI